MAQKINEMVLEGLERFEGFGEDFIRELSEDVDEYNNWGEYMQELKKAIGRDPGWEMKLVVENLDKAMMNQEKPDWFMRV